jgi:class 3 adenylate cyclase
MTEQTKNEISPAISVSYDAMIMVMQLFKIVSAVIIIIFLLSFIIPYLIAFLPVIYDVVSLPYIAAALNLERSLSLAIQSHIPMKVADISIIRLGVIIVAYLMYTLFKNVQESYRDRLTKIQFKNEFDTLKKQMGLSDNDKILRPLREKLENPMHMKKKDREQLLKLFAETKRKLDSMGRDLAFLSIDIVDSTGMKENEEKAAIEYDFKQYKQYVEEIIRSNGALKYSWTPDGVMICFKTADDAVKSAREVIEGLEDFNAHVKTMKRNFIVRCGINAGYVYFDESLPMEEMSDRVIDIAGHMQKHSAPNTISIAKPIVEPLQSRSGFVRTAKVIDGYEVYILERRKVPRD